MLRHNHFRRGAMLIGLLLLVCFGADLHPPLLFGQSATPLSVGLGYRPMATVEARGLKRISGTSPAMGNLSSGMKTSVSSIYEFKVEDVAQAAITLFGDFGVGEIAVIRYAKKP